MLLISHRYNTVRAADHIYVLADGRIIEHGSHEQLIATNGTYAELFTLQAAAYTDQPAAGRHVPTTTPPSVPTPEHAAAEEIRS